ncbi:MAG: hypothetical protein MIL41_21885 [Hyphomicrobiales bacterium]|jgi:hypothetical protein
MPRVCAALLLAGIAAAALRPRRKLPTMVVGHWSDCAVHNEPAYPAGPCDCGGFRYRPTLH